MKKKTRKPVDPEIAEWVAQKDERFKEIIRYLKRLETERKARAQTD